LIYLKHREEIEHGFDGKNGSIKFQVSGFRLKAAYIYPATGNKTQATNLKPET
jgi:hypothetical protein